MDLVETLLSDYNFYRRQTKNAYDMEHQHGVPFRPKRMDKATRKLLEDSIAWCREKQTEPRFWIFHLFEARAWRFGPQLKIGHICSEKMLEKLGKMRKRTYKGYGIEFFQRRRDASDQERKKGERYDPNRDVSPTVEAIKEQYLRSGLVDVCRASSLTETMGFHPLSTICDKCPLALDCMIDLQSVMPFSILALRTGRMDSATAERLANERHTTV